MAVLGQAIARHLSSLRGLYFVELPEALASEMVSLVQQANSPLAPRRALLVASGPAAPVPALANVTIGWRDILAWRTDEDRVFVWQRGLHEPDSSFQSVVRPFISRRFPGAGGGECSLSQLVRACVRELWERRTWLPNGEVFDAFLLTAEWVTDVLYEFFEDAGNTPSQHWSDRFLTHFASMFDTLDAGLAAFTGLLVPRHAWEVVRLSGLPLPSALVKDSNPFLQPPALLPVAQVKKFTGLWTDVVQKFFLREGGVAEFMAALDAETVGVPKISPWRGFNWAEVQKLPPDAPAPVVGAAVFASPPSPTILSATIPNTSAPSHPSWWGVTTDNLVNARSRLSESTPLVPDASRPGFLPLWEGANATYVLDTRNGTVTYIHAPTRWRARVALTDLGFRYKENWQTLHVSETEPPTGAEGDAWVNPQSVHVEMKNCIFDQQRVIAGAGGQLQVLFNLLLEYSVGLDRASHDVSGTWSPSRKLKVEVPVRLRHAGHWDVELKVEAEIRVMIPSPFAPTVFVVDGAKLEAVGPDSEDTYSATNAGSTQWAATTPTIMLSEEGQYGVLLYDGSLEPWSPVFRDLAIPSLGTAVLPVPTGAFFPQTSHNLDDNVVLSDANSTHGGDVVVFQVKQRSTNVSSGILAAVRELPSGRRPPASMARNSVLGKYQDHITPTICSASGSPLDSLYQFVIGASEQPIIWADHPGGPAPLMLFQHVSGFVLPGISNGPSAALVGCPEWGVFMAAMGQACASLGLRPGAEGAWLSGIDPSTLPAAQLRTVLETHRALVSAAATPADRFWASYPFSVLVVEGTLGVNFGQLKAVFLSPLHPVRLAWGFAVASVARRSGVDHGLLGLLEGWNLPAAGGTLNPAGEFRWLVAVPMDPGSEQDFVGWSALAVLGPGGTADLPLIGGGQALPWGGRTGINARVVERSLKDYLAAHPHINALEVDIRSVGGSPRSAEIDDTLLELLGGAELDHISDLGGGTKVWDSLDRHGKPPTRDNLFNKRRLQEAERSFEWRVYSDANSPSDADVALIENATVHLTVSVGKAYGVVGILPLRRFFTADLGGMQLDQNVLPRDGEDILGLASLLRVIESPEGADKICIRATPQMHALGIGKGAQWEVLGTFNIDPSLLATLVATAPATSGKRLLWEWRPSWMVADKSPADLARRPYYVIARVPASLTRALHARQGISQPNAEELLCVLGQRGVGLAALNAEGGTQESAAAGFFYAIQLLRPSTGASPFDGLAQQNHPLVYGVLPLDPIEPMLQGLAGRPLERRADMLALAISRGTDGVLRLCIVPAEVKHHGMPSNPEKLPEATDLELRRAREQLTQTVTLLREIITGIAGTSDNEAGLRYLKRLALATLVDLAFSFSPVPPSSALRSEVLADLLGGPLAIGIGDPILLWFAPGSIHHTGQPHVLDPHPSCTIDSLRVREVYLDPCAVPGLWWSGVASGAADSQTRVAIDSLVRSSFAKCADGVTTVPPNRDDLARLLGLVPALDALPTGVPPAPPAPPTEPLAADATLPPADGGLPVPAPPTVPRPLPTAPLPDATAQTPPAPPTEVVADTAAPVPQPTATAAPVTVPPRAVLGWTELSNRWSLVGKLTPGDEPVAIDLDHPKTVGIFGFMGSGKSYLLGNLIESALMEIPGVNRLPAPLAVVIFNYRRNASDRFELSSMAEPNDDPGDVRRLAEEYGATPEGADNFRVLCLPGELRTARLQEYGSLPASELFFSPARLDVEDWELLMGEPGSEAVFARTIRNSLIDLRSAGDITLDRLEQDVSDRLTGQSRAAARLRFEFVRRYISEERGANFGDFVQPGRALIIDLRQPLFNKEDALRFFLVCANQVSRVQGRFNKVVIFDEAHEYMSDAFGDRMESRIRQMRHEGTSYVFATQDTGSIPIGISRFLTTRFVFNLGTRENVEDLEKVAPEFRGMSLLTMRPGHCLVQANSSTQGLFTRPREIRVRPRVTKHGGASRIFPGT